MKKYVLLSLILLVIAALLGLFGCSNTSNPNDSTPTSAEQTSESTLGTQNNQLPLGTTVTLKNWEVTPVAVELNANDKIAALDPRNPKAPRGSRYVIVSIEATNTGEKPAMMLNDIFPETFDSSGQGHEASVLINMPDIQGITGSDEALPGNTVNDNIVFAVPTDKLNNATLVLKSPGSKSAYFSLS